jgi:hypothetical protein
MLTPVSGDPELSDFQNQQVRFSIILKIVGVLPWITELSS